MATAFDPGLGSLGAFALGRCGVRRAAIDTGHLTDVAMAANLVLSDWSLDEPQLWSVQQRSFLLGQGTTTYILPHDVLMVLDVFLRTNPGTLYEIDGFGQPVLDGFGNLVVITQGDPAANLDRILYKASRSEYASFPNKNRQSPPTVYWTDRVVPIQVSFYPAPDARQYLVNYFCIVQQQDQVLTGDLSTGSPYRMISAFADAIAAKLSLSYKPEAFELLDKVAERSYTRAHSQENESVPIYIQPVLLGYFR
jgi:hypothetical protein